jgi:transposase
MADWLLRTSGAEAAGHVLDAIEVPHGPVVEALTERGFAVHAINPKQMDRFRDRFSMSGAKDDNRDAEVMASSLRTDPRCFRKLAAADPVVVELREWSRIAEELGVERNRLANRLREQLWRYFPALLEIEEDCGDEWLLEFLVLAPTPAKAVRLREAKVAELLKQRRIRRFDAAAILKAVRAPPPQRAPGTIEAASAHVASIIPRLRLVNRQVRETERKIGALIDSLTASPESEPGQKKQHGAAILASLPGVGRTVLATLLAEAWEPLQRRDYLALRSFVGGSAGYKAIRQELRRHAPTSSRQPPRQRPLPLGARRRAARSAMPRQICRNAQARSYSRSSSPRHRRSKPKCRLRHAQDRSHVQSCPSNSKNRLINGGESPRLALADLGVALPPPLRAVADF